MDEKLPDGWELTTLDDIITPERVLEHPGEFSTLQFIGLEHVEAETMRLIGTMPARDLKSTALHFWPGDVLYGRLRPYLNKVFRPHFEGLCSAEFLVFRKLADLNSSYLQYFLNSWNFKEFASQQITGDRPRVNWDKLKVFNFPLSPLPEQSRIVAAIEQQFTRLDSAVGSLQSAKARVKQYRASLLKSAVEGELTKEWRIEHPVEETGEQLLRRILVEYRIRWEAAELAKLRDRGITPKDNKWKQMYKEPQIPIIGNLPKLPEGWCYTFLLPLLSVSRKGMVTGPFGSLLKKYEHHTDGVPVLGIENIESMRFIAGSKIHITQEKAVELSQYDALSGDVLISRSGTVGEVCVVPENLGEARISTNLMRVSLAEGGMLPQFFCLLFNGSPTVLDQVSEFCKGSTRDFLSQSILGRIIFPLPPLAEQEQIVAEVEASLSNIAKLEETTENNLKRAEHERQSILQEAFAGRLVLQDMNDEPASVLLERIREERKKREEAEKIVKASRKGDHVGSAKRLRVGRVASGQRNVGLYEKLVEAGQPLSPDDLFKGVGLRADAQPESVEEFYEELHADVVAGLIEEGRPSADKVLLYAVEHENEDLEEVEEVLREDDTVPVVVEEMPEVREKENRRSLWDE